MIPDVILDHVAPALERLTDRYRDKEVTKNFLDSLVTPCNALEASIWDAINGRILGADGCTGIWLDRIGRIVGEPRLGRSDGDYELAIQIRVVINRSRGRSVDVIRVALLLSELATYVEYFPFGWEVEIYETELGGAYIRSLTQAKAAASYGVLLTSNWEGELFEWSYPKPVVTSVTPNTGTTAGGTAITITGQNFHAGATATLYAAIPMTSLVVVSDTEITCVTNAAPAGAKTCRVYNGALFGDLLNAFTYV